MKTTLTAVKKAQAKSVPASVVPELNDIPDSVLDELTRRVQDIDNSYRAVAEKMGQLYMSADANSVVSLTRALDKPMRNASDNEQTFAAILAELRMLANRRG